MKKYLLFATAFVALASCSDDTFVGENSSPNTNEDYGGAINFGLSMQKMTRGDIYGSEAAKLLNNNFYVMGTKGTEPTNSPTTTVVFDNYLVHYGVNTAGTTQSNTANWEYVGVTPGTGDYTSYVKLSSLNTQTIKYWDYSQPQYDFLAFSTGKYAAVSGSSTASTNIGVTAIQSGATLSSGAYTFDIPSVDALKNTYITDIKKVEKTSFGKEVQLKFKNLGSKVRIGLYETVPGYSVKDVAFYTVEGLATPTDLGTGTSGTAALISNIGIPSTGQITVLFPHIGSSNASETDYNKASASVTAGASPLTSMTFGTLNAQLVAKERDEATGGNVYLGRTLTQTSFAGSKDANFYETVFPVSDPAPLVLRVDYTLVPIDGAAETIIVKGAKAVVPSTYTKWLPNYAYTYIFKISDNTNGWTGTTSDAPGLFPITFDAVVTEATDVTGEQTTITTVSTPTITTYQQCQDPNYDLTTTSPSTNEYSKSTKGKDNVVRDVYVQVMDNTIVPALLVGTSNSDNSVTSSLPLLNGTTSESTARSLLYAVTLAPSSKTTISEATVMDALENQASVVSSVITGRNGVILTPDAHIDATVTKIVNGVDDNPIDLSTAGKTAKIDMSASGVAAGTYAFVYDYSNAAKTTTDIYQPITLSVGADVEGVKYITNTALGTWDDGTTAAHYTSSSENAVKNYLYFSITTNGGATKTYSFISVDDKIGNPLPDGLLKVPTSALKTGAASETAVAGNIYFTIYTRNDGAYAVKVIKIVA